MAGNTAAMLARGVLNSMLLNQVKVATMLLCLGIGGSYWAWHALAGAADEKGRGNPGQVAQDPCVSRRSHRRPNRAVAYRLTGSVRVEGTGEPVAGATVDVMIADSGQAIAAQTGLPCPARTAVTPLTSRRAVPLLDADRARRLLGPAQFPEVRGVCRLQGRAGLSQGLCGTPGHRLGFPHHPRPPGEASPRGGHGFRQGRVFPQRCGRRRPCPPDPPHRGR